MPTKTIIIISGILAPLLIVRFKINKSSAIKLNEGGVAMLDIKTKNHSSGRDALHPSTPLVSKILRE